MAAPTVVSFADAIVEVMADYDVTMTLKSKQEESLKSIYEDGGDVIINLPTGYGKSMIFIEPTRHAQG